MTPITIKSILPSGPLKTKLIIINYNSHDKRPIKEARYSFSGPIPPKFERKLRRHKQSFGKIVTTVVLDKDENLL